MNFEFSLQIFEKKVLNVKFHQNPSPVTASCSMRTDRQTKPIVASGNIANAPKNSTKHARITHQARRNAFMLKYTRTQRNTAKSFSDLKSHGVI
jgi:hypothetical protein